MSTLNIYTQLRCLLLAILLFIVSGNFAQQADFSVNNSSQCIQGNSFSFSNQSTAGATAYQWNFGDGTLSSEVNPIKTFTSSGNYNVQLIATYNGINYYTSKSVAVNPAPQCTFTYLAATGIGNSYTYQSTSQIASGNMNYNWNFGDGTSGTSSNPTHTYLNNGVYNVTLSVVSDFGCSSTVSQYVTVTISATGNGASSLFSFCIDKSHQCLSGNSFTFSNTSNGNAGTTYSWNFGDGTTSTDANPTKSYSNPGTYTVSLIATYNGINYITTKTITVDTPPNISLGGIPCTSNVLTATVANNTQIAKLVWNIGGVASKTVVPNWNNIGLTVAGGNGAAPFEYPVIIGNSHNQLGGPRGVFMDREKNLYVIDNSLGRIQKWTHGAHTGTAIACGTQKPGGTVDCKGNLFVSDDVDNNVTKWAPGATTGVVVAGGNGTGNAANQLHDPRGNLFVDKNDNLYINDCYNHRIQMWAPNAVVGVTVAGGNGQGNGSDQFNYPQGFFMDDANTIYIADAGNHRIQKWVIGASSGITVAGGNGQGTADNQLYNPLSVYVDKAGNVYVDDMTPTGHRIQLWTVGANAGITILQPSANFSNIATAICWVDTENGDIYVADESNNVVKKYSISGINLTDTANVAGNYTVTATNFTGCTSTSIGISVNSLPILNPITGTSSFCFDNAVTFTNTIQGGIWGCTNPSIATINSNGQIVPVTSGMDTITYTVTQNGCSSTVYKQIVINPLTNINLTGGGACANLLTANISGGTASNLIWSLNGLALDTVYPSYNINAATIAGGNGTGNASNQFDGNSGVALDSHGNLYVVDANNNRIQKFAPGASVGVTVAGGNGIGNATNQLSYPQGIFIDKNDNLYVTDNGNARVQKFTLGSTNGVTVAGGNGAGSNANQLNTVLFGLFVDVSGNVYVSDLINSRVQRWDVGATTGITVAGGNGQGNAANQLLNPYGIFVDGAANVYVADQGNYRVQKWANGAPNGVTVAGGTAGPPYSAHLTGVTDIVVDATGAIYISDYYNRIMRWQENAAFGIKLFGSNPLGGSGISELNNVYGFCIATNGDIYVSDKGNDRIQKLTINSLVNILIPTTSGTYSVTAHSFAGCSYTASTNVTSLGVQPIINITAGASCQKTVCAGSSVTFNADIVNGGNSPFIQWKVNGVAASIGNTFTTTSLNNGDIVTAELTSNASCPNPNPAISNAITMTVNILPTISVSGNCKDSLISINSNSALNTISWSLGGTILSTITPTWNTSGITVAGGLGNGKSANQLSSPTDVFIDTAGNIYVADLFNNRIQKFPSNSLSGTNGTTVAGQSNCVGGGNLNQLLNPHGLTLDDAGNIYVTNSAFHRVDKWAPNASFGVTVAGGNGQGNASNQLFIPRRIAVDKCGNLYIPDNYNHRIQKWTIGASSGITVAGGNGLGSAANQLNYPSDVALDAVGNIYVADANNNRVQKFPPNSTSATNGVTVAGTGIAGASMNQLDNAYGIYVDGAGNVIVADANNARIMYWAVGSSSGVLVAGGNGWGNSANQFNYPTNVTLDKQGNLYVTDEHNDRVQKFTVSSGTFTPATVGNYTVSVIGNDGCVSTQNVVITNCVASSAGFTVNNSSQCLTNNNFVFTNTSNFPVGATYNWNFGDGNSSTNSNPAHTYSSPGYFNVTLKATLNGIDYYSSQTITVNPSPIVGFTFSPNTGTGNSYTFNSTSTISSGGMNYNWDFGDGNTTSGISNPLHIYLSNGTYNVNLTVTGNGGCTSSASQSIIVTNSGNGGSTPVLSFTDNGDMQCLNVNNYVFTNLSTSPNGTTYLWNFGDGSSSNALTATHRYANAGYYNVTLKATYNGIDYYSTRQVIVKAMPTASFTNYLNSPNTYTFNSTSSVASGSFRTYYWNFGDGGIDSISNPQHTFTSAGSQTIKLIVTSDGGCIDSTTNSLFVCPELNNQAFRINAAHSCLKGNFWGVQNYYGNNLYYPMTYLWDYGDGTTSTLQSPPWHTYSSSGTFTISLKVTLSYPGCPVLTSNYAIPISVSPMPIASFDITGSDTILCFTPSNNYHFVNNSNVSSGLIMNNMWDFGDGSTSSIANPTKSFDTSGTFKVRLVVSTEMACNDTVIKTIVLHPIPFAQSLNIGSFTGTPDHPLELNQTPSNYVHSMTMYDTVKCLNEYAWFYNTVSGNFTSAYDYWKVNFDDGTSGIGTGMGHGHPYHQYTTSGTHFVSGNIISDYGCISNTVYGRVILNPNSDTIPHAAIGLHSSVVHKNGYDTYQLNVDNLSTTACSPIINSYWTIEMIGGDMQYFRGTLWYNSNYYFVNPTASDMAGVGFDANPSNLPTIKVTLITVNDVGIRDTAIAYFGSANSGYTLFDETGNTLLPQIDLYPNPSHDNVSVGVQQVKVGNLTMEIFDNLGRKVLSKKQYSYSNKSENFNLNISPLIPGTYHIRIMDTDGKLMGYREFIKE